MKSSFLLQCSFILAIKTGFGEGRSWEDVIDHSIYGKSLLDVTREQHRYEMDPFLTRTDKEEKNVSSNMPLPDPCIGDSVHYKLNMYDNIGDGWESTTTVHISEVFSVDDISDIETGTQNDGSTFYHKTVSFAPGGLLSSQTFRLENGSSSDANLCLFPDKCYEIKVGGGDSMDGVSWDITQQDSSKSYVTGNAPMRCKFSIPDADGTFKCSIECNNDVPDLHEDEDSKEHLIGGNIGTLSSFHKTRNNSQRQNHVEKSTGDSNVVKTATDTRDWVKVLNSGS